MNSEMIMKLVDEYAWRAHVDSDKGLTGKARDDVVAAIEKLAKDAVRYQWLRRGDNDKIILRVAYLPRNENLDVVIDTAMKESK